MKSKFQFTFALVIMLMIGSFTFTVAQTDDTKAAKGGWAVRIAQARAHQQAERESGHTGRANDIERGAQTAAPEKAQEDAESQNELFGWQPLRRPEPLVGTWYVNIPTSNGGLPPFNALQTFNDGGTFTESSDLLVTQTEGPAFGVWKGNGARYNLTFQLFIFDPEKKESVGMVRVRAVIRMISNDEFVADSAVDFIAPDGTVEKGIDGGPFHGKRVKVLPVN